MNDRLKLMREVAARARMLLSHTVPKMAEVRRVPVDEAVYAVGSYDAWDTSPALQALLDCTLKGSLLIGVEAKVVGLFTEREIAQFALAYHFVSVCEEFNVTLPWIEAEYAVCVVGSPLTASVPERFFFDTRQLDSTRPVALGVGFVTPEDWQPPNDQGEGNYLVADVRNTIVGTCVRLGWSRSQCAAVFGESCFNSSAWNN